jgi:hypothetical protein
LTDIKITPYSCIQAGIIVTKRGIMLNPDAAKKNHFPQGADNYSLKLT